MANAFDDLPPVNSVAGSVPVVPEAKTNAFDDLTPPIVAKALERVTPYDPLTDLKHLGGMALRVGTQAVTSLPFMAEDAGVAARNLYSGVTGGSYHQYDYPSDTARAAMDTYFGKPQGDLERAEDALLPMAVGFGATRLPGAIAPIVAGGGAPEAAQVPMFDAAGNALALAPRTMTSAQSKSQMLVNTLRASQDAGYVVPRATTNPTMSNRLVEMLGGKVGTAQEASVRNQAATNRLAAESVGLNPEVSITPEALKSVRTDAGKAYDDMRSLGPVAPDDKLRADMQAVRDRIGGVESDFPGSKASPIAAEVNSILGVQPAKGRAAAPPRSLGTIQSTPENFKFTMPAAAPVVPRATGPGLDPLTLMPRGPADGLGALGNPAPPPPSVSMAPATPGPASSVRTDALLRPQAPPAYDALGAAANGARGPASGSGNVSNVALDPLTLNPRTRTFDSSNMITKIGNLRDAADVAGRSGDKGLAASYKQVADALEAQIDRHIQGRIAAGDSSIDPNAVANFRDSRQLIAKTYSIEKALNPATGDVSTAALARMVKSGDPISGGLRTAGNFGAAFEKASQPPAKIGSAGVNHLEGGLTGMAALTGALLGGHSEHSVLGTAAGAGLGMALPFARRAAVNYALGSGQAGAIPAGAASALYDLGPTKAKAALIAALQQAHRPSSAVADAAPQ